MGDSKIRGAIKKDERITNQRSEKEVSRRHEGRTSADRDKKKELRMTLI